MIRFGFLFRAVLPEIIRAIVIIFASMRKILNMFGLYTEAQILESWDSAKAPLVDALVNDLDGVKDELQQKLHGDAVISKNDIIPTIQKAHHVSVMFRQVKSAIFIEFWHNLKSDDPVKKTHKSILSEE
jgi:hypothetical protein